MLHQTALHVRASIGHSSSSASVTLSNSIRMADNSAPRSDVPDNSNTGCVGTQSDQAGKSAACAGCPNQKICASGEAKKADPALAQVADRLADVKHKILVLSGKGGVGKSTFSTQLAFSLAAKGYQVGLLDVDICGPSVPRMLGLVGQEVHQSGRGWSPVYVEDNLGVMSIGFMLPDNDDPVIWRGPRKNGLIKQFLTDVDWGTLDYLIVDTPPGTSDEHISIVQYLKSSQVDGAVVVTTPQEVAMADVRKELNFCKRTGLNVLGVVENMSGLQLPLSRMRFMSASGEDRSESALATLREKAPELLDLLATTDVFPASGSGPKGMAEAFDVPFLGRLPIDSRLTACCEQGLDFGSAHADSPAAPALGSIVDAIVAATPDSDAPPVPPSASDSS